MLKFFITLQDTTSRPGLLEDHLVDDTVLIVPKQPKIETRWWQRLRVYAMVSNGLLAASDSGQRSWDRQAI